MCAVPQKIVVHSHVFEISIFDGLCDIQITKKYTVYQWKITKDNYSCSLKMC